MKAKEEFMELLRSTNREGVEDLSFYKVPVKSIFDSTVILH